MSDAGEDSGSITDGFASDVFLARSKSEDAPPGSRAVDALEAAADEASTKESKEAPAMMRSGSFHLEGFARASERRRSVYVKELVEKSEIRSRRSVGDSLCLVWDAPPTSALIVKKPGDAETTNLMVRTSRYLLTRGIYTYVQSPVIAEQEAGDIPADLDLTEWFPGGLMRPDFIISLGGDGTILYIGSLFDGSVPPVISFAMGSLGFLTVFDAADAEQTIDRLLAGELILHARMRLCCRVSPPEGSDEEAVEHHVLNELVCDRGPSPYLSRMETYVDGQMVTLIQADGIIIATPTGSTAYSVAAGGSMVHPSVLGILFTPICPHSLSFRPLIFPDSVTLVISVPEDARGSAWLSFDGRDRMELPRGGKVTVSMSKWPLPTVSQTTRTTEWFYGLQSCLNWNVRQVQKPMDEKKKKAARPSLSHGSAMPIVADAIVAEEAAGSEDEAVAPAPSDGSRSPPPAAAAASPPAPLHPRSPLSRAAATPVPPSPAMGGAEFFPPVAVGLLADEEESAADGDVEEMEAGGDE